MFLNAQVEACRVSYDRSLVRRPHKPVVFVEFYVRQNQPIVYSCLYLLYTILVLDKHFGFLYCVPLVEHSRSLVKELIVEAQKLS